MILPWKDLQISLNVDEIVKIPTDVAMFCMNSYNIIHTSLLDPPIAVHFGLLENSKDNKDTVRVTTTINIEVKLRMDTKNTRA